MSDKEPRAEEFYSGMYDGIYASLCSNHMTSAVAHFLANMAVELEKLKRHEL